ncbi:DUF3656 domain-containing U32 family peptidase [Clostridium rectalis]|uniref:DUF3656 domain-containing U32 family peptidase n=1 Tax=Clostridium rectalis TaxID=2040295 RepID=UPI000F63B98D|nr:U32 family peptidase [Clostridium rectalis]
MNNIELLAPAGSIESLHAAVLAGANAVYLGGSKFSARAYASNFNDENMKDAINYCHLYGVKVYVTLNTLLKDEEMEEAIDYARFLYNIGVDGLIVQDTGLIYFLNKEIPNLELHASTQMTVHNLEGAKLLKELNFKRIVLSRELSLNEIKYISENLGVEIEIFIHGALCVCYSGQCLMSSIIGGRSGNRGRCAQPCRLPYTLIDKNTGRKEKAYILSPKDICTLDNIKEILLSGVTSLKIEGRMKRPEYVAGVVDTYRRAIDFVQNNTEKKQLHFEKDNKKLLQLFNREGFSKAYLFGNVGKDMMSYSYPKNTGLYLGKINKDLTVTLKEDLILKDGIRNKDKGFTISKITKQDREVDKAFKGDKVKLFPANYIFGDELYKTSDILLLSSYEKFYNDPYNKKLDIEIDVNFRVNEPITISTKVNNKTIIHQGHIIQQAKKRPLDKKKIEENLKKTRNTAFQVNNINFISFEEGFLPVSSINEVRRELISMLQEEIINGNSKRENTNKNLNCKKINKLSIEKYELPKTLVCITTKEQLRAAKSFNIKDIAFNPFLRRNELNLFDFINEGINVYIKIPNIIKDEFHSIYNYIENNLNSIKGIITANLGIINKFRNKTIIISDYKLNIFNNYSLDFYKNFIHGYCASVELNKSEISKLKHSNLQIIVYGKIELMISEYCPIGSIFGGKDSNNVCTGYCKDKSFGLIDRKNEEFSIYTDKFCRSYIYNNVPLNLISNISELEKIKVKNFRLDFIDEDFIETSKVLEAFINKNWVGNDLKGFTRGHYKRGVE